MPRRSAFAGLFFFVLIARLCHIRILWIEECYPAAGALQILSGALPYRDFWFDKPPLTMAIYTLWGAEHGWPLRLAGAVYITFVCWLLNRFAADKWGEKEGWLAAGLGALFLTFGIPSAVMALAPDLLMIAPHVLAVYLAWRRLPLLAGLTAGVAMLVNAKAVFVLAACFLFQPASGLYLLAGFVIPNVLVVGWLALAGALPAYWEQVWQFGLIYSRDTFVAEPLAEGLSRTLNWAGFHSALVLGAAWYWWKEHDRENLRFLLWTGVCVVAVVAGWRFFPRYYFHLLPVMILAGARGISLLGKRRAALLLVLLLLPVLRFGPRYVNLASDLIAGSAHEWRDLAMFDGSRQAADVIGRESGPGDTLLVWGYRPDISVLTRLPAGSPFLDSQPLTGVIADRHLVDSRPSAPGLAESNRQELKRHAPTFIVDGLGPYNPDLAISSYEDLKEWLENYEVLAELPSAVVYRLVKAPTRRALLQER